MQQSATVRARINPVLKSNVEHVLAHLGITLSEAIKIYMYQIVLRNGIPFELEVPNAETLKTFEATDKGEGLTEYENAEAMFKKLGI